MHAADQAADAEFEMFRDVKIADNRAKRIDGHGLALQQGVPSNSSSSRPFGPPEECMRVMQHKALSSKKHRDCYRDCPSSGP